MSNGKLGAIEPKMATFSFQSGSMTCRTRPRSERWTLESFDSDWGILAMPNRSAAASAKCGSTTARPTRLFRAGGSDNRDPPVRRGQVDPIEGYPAGQG